MKELCAFVKITAMPITTINILRFISDSLFLSFQAFSLHWQPLRAQRIHLEAPRVAEPRTKRLHRCIGAFESTNDIEARNTFVINIFHINGNNYYARDFNVNSLKRYSYVCRKFSKSIFEELDLSNDFDPLCSLVLSGA